MALCPGQVIGFVERFLGAVFFVALRADATHVVGAPVAFDQRVAPGGGRRAVVRVDGFFGRDQSFRRELNGRATAASAELGKNCSGNSGSQGCNGESDHVCSLCHGSTPPRIWSRWYHRDLAPGTGFQGADDNFRLGLSRRARWPVPTTPGARAGQRLRALRPAAQSAFRLR